MTARRVPQRTLRRIVELATRAPSVHNTQPWRWRGGPHSLELYADRSRQLSAGDPEGRNLVISCGVALHHAQVAADALGWGAMVTRFPDPDQPDLLARVALAPSTPSRHAPELLEAIDKRCTDRRRFTVVAGPRRAAHPPRRPGLVPGCPRTPPHRRLGAVPRRAAHQPRHRPAARRPARDAGAAGVDRPRRRSTASRPTVLPVPDDLRARRPAGSRPACSTTSAAARSRGPTG